MLLQQQQLLLCVIRRRQKIGGLGLETAGSRSGGARGGREGARGCSETACNSQYDTMPVQQLQLRSFQQVKNSPEAHAEYRMSHRTAPDSICLG